MAGGPVCRPYGEQQALSRSGGRGNSLFPLSRCARHLPLIRGVVLPYDSQEYLLELGRGGPWASRQDTHRERWLKKPRRMSGTAAAAIFANPGPSGPAGIQTSHSDFARRKFFTRLQKSVPRNGVRGKRCPMGTKCPSAASPVAFWLLCRHGQSNSPPAGGEISSADNEPNPNPVPSSVTVSPCHLSLSPLSLRDISP